VLACRAMSFDRVSLVARRPVFGAAVLFSVAVLSGCGAVYPEIATPLRAAGTRTLDPPPPDDLLFIKFARAEIPSRTRDGRNWDSVGGSAPDPFAKLLIGDKEILVTPVQANTLTPTWPDQKLGNYHVPKGVPVRVELWDSNPINNHPICVESINNIHGEASMETNVDLRCDSGASIELTVQPAHAKFGIGLYYELRTAEIVVTRTVPDSPAARAGLKRGDQLIQIQGKSVKDLDQDSARSVINSNVTTGVNLTVKHADGSVSDVTLKDGPIYPSVQDDIAVD